MSDEHKRKVEPRPDLSDQELDVLFEDLQVDLENAQRDRPEIEQLSDEEIDRTLAVLDRLRIPEPCDSEGELSYNSRRLISDALRALLGKVSCGVISGSETVAALDLIKSLIKSPSD